MSESGKVKEPVWSSQAEYDALRFVTPESPCPYLLGKLARNEVYLADGLDGQAYSALLARGFRRSGRVVYRPRCRTCRECRQLRIPVTEFRPSRSQRRVWRRNSDVRVEQRKPIPTPEKYDLYHRYLNDRHDGTMSDSFDAFVAFLYDSPFDTIEFQYYLGQRLVGVSLVDRCSDGLSSVYMYFDPAESARSLGSYSAMWEIDICRREGLPYYYFGYYVAQSEPMSYKARFRPNQVLVADQRWITLRT